MVVLRPVRGGVSPHTHDFAEIMLVLEGNGLHRINGRRESLAAGDLVFVQPTDHHSIEGTMRFVNVAFPVDLWDRFTALAGGQAASTHLRGQRHRTATNAFRQALEAYCHGPTRLDLCRFFIDVVHCTAPVPAPYAGYPDWLADACERMHLGEHLRQGLPEFIRLCGRSGAHLSRTLQRLSGLTPTQYVNQLRLRQASVLLTTTDQAVVDVALECGFENLSHFYHGFTTLFGEPPHQYRMRSAHQILPPET
ncbi:MAG TPA: AraC family transcriptional regulator [Candidatus Xenobia bacterium]